MSTLFFYILSALLLSIILAFGIGFWTVGPEQTFNTLFPWRIITNPEDDGPYMIRWFTIRRRAIATFIHKFLRSDYDRALHDRPWDFLVIPVWRGYMEHNERLKPCLHCGGIGAFTQRLREEGKLCAYCKGKGMSMQPNVTRVYPIIGTRFRRAEYKHRVELFRREGISEQTRAIVGTNLEEFLPSWSIFIRFRKRRHWGFWCPMGWVPHRDGVKDHCNP